MTAAISRDVRALNDALRDALARIIAARDYMGDGDNRLADAVLHDLEIDLAGSLDLQDEKRAA